MVAGPGVGGRGVEPGGLTASDLGPDWQRVSKYSPSLCVYLNFFSLNITLNQNLQG